MQKSAENQSRILFSDTAFILTQNRQLYEVYYLDFKELILLNTVFAKVLYLFYISTSVLISLMSVLRSLCKSTRLWQDID